MVKILYYLIIKPLSVMPMWLLHRLADILYVISYYIIGYRKKVVLSNLAIALPNKTDKERKQILKGAYRNFCDIIIESIKLFSISENELKKRMVINGLDQLIPYYKQGKSVIGLTSHVANWEWMVISDKLMKHRSLGIMTPLSNSFVNKKMIESRTRFGCRAIPKAEFKSVIASEYEPTTYFFASDQSPHKANRAYWTTFFGLDTAVQYGAEKFAKQYDLPVFHFKISRVKRGYYEVETSPLELNPTKSEYGHIMTKYTEELEEHIKSNISDWLWTHRRWKHKRTKEKV